MAFVSEAQDFHLKGGVANKSALLNRLVTVAGQLGIHTKMSYIYCLYIHIYIYIFGYIYIYIWRYTYMIYMYIHMFFNIFSMPKTSKSPHQRFFKCQVTYLHHRPRQWPRRSKLPQARRDPKGWLRKNPSDLSST